MSCKHCHRLCQVRRIKIEEGLDRWLAEVRGDLGEGVLVELPPPLTHRSHPRPALEQLAADGPWDDQVLEYQFQCHFCGEVFEFHLDPLAGTAQWLPRDRGSRW